MGFSYKQFDISTPEIQTTFAVKQVIFSFTCALRKCGTRTLLEPSAKRLHGNTFSTAGESLLTCKHAREQHKCKNNFIFAEIKFNFLKSWIKVYAMVLIYNRI